MSSTAPNTIAKLTRRHILVIAGLIVAVLTFIFGDNIYDRYIRGRQQPRFTVSAINTLGGRESKTYEITNHLIGISPTNAITVTWGLEIIPEYHGNRSYGEIRVLIKNSRGEVVAEGHWADFNKESKLLVIPLDPYRLSNEVGRIGLYGGFRDNIFEGKTFESPAATFDIEIVQASRLASPLLRDKLTLRNAPWYHYTAMSAWYDGSIDVFVYGKNLGDPSDFYVIGSVFEITEVPGAPWVNWPWVDSQQVIITDVDSGEEFTAKLTFPQGLGFTFERGKVYIIETYLIKRQNYVQFSDGPWDSTSNKWRFGSFVTQHLVQPP